MKQFVQNRLAILARAIIKKYQPIVIGITGSVGKTSARDAIFAVVRTKFSARKPDKNYNNEIGLPLTIIGAEAPGRNILAWLGVFLKGYGLLIARFPYPEVLVLEMGVDHPGDMDHLLSIAQPHIAVVTYIGSAHLEFFASTEQLAQEKRKIIEHLHKLDFAILNADSEKVMAQRDFTEAKVLSYGVNPAADIQVSVIQEELTVPAHSRIRSGNIEVDVAAVGAPHLSACAAALAVAIPLQIEPELVKKGLHDYRPEPGRLNLLSGIKETTILEDSYNASPDSVKEALSVLWRMPNQAKIVVLGDMLELGDSTAVVHEHIGGLIAAQQPAQLITVGNKAQLIAIGAQKHGYPKNQIHSFANSDEVKTFMLENLIPGSAILIKGSQGARMEKISKEILAEPMSAHNVLPRQYGKWL